MFMRVYFTSPPAEQRLAGARQENADWLKRFQQLRSLSLTGQEWLAEATRLREAILRQLQWEERELYPALDKFLLSSRPTRDMFYEHEGIRRYLPEMEEALASPERDRRWERFSLNLIHLLEHHIEHEERGLYPVYERLLEGGKGAS